MIIYVYTSACCATFESGCNTLSHVYKELPSYYDYDNFDRDNSLEALAEIKLYVDHICQLVLKAIRRVVPGQRVLKLPCWSARRWKSLT